MKCRPVGAVLFHADG